MIIAVFLTEPRTFYGMKTAVEKYTNASSYQLNIAENDALELQIVQPKVIGEQDFFGMKMPVFQEVQRTIVYAPTEDSKQIAEFAPGHWTMMLEYEAALGMQETAKQPQIIKK